MLKDQRDPKLSKTWLLRNLAGTERGYKEQYGKDEKASQEFGQRKFSKTTSRL